MACPFCAINSGMPLQVSDPLDVRAPPSWLRSLLYAALFGASVLVASWTTVPDAQLIILGPAAGVGALWLLGVIDDRRQTIVDGAALTLTAAAITSLSGTSWGPALVDGLGHSLQAITLAWLVARTSGPTPRLRTPRDLALLVRAGLIACLLGAVVFTAGTVWTAALAGGSLTGAHLAVVALTTWARDLAWATLIVAAGLRSADPLATADLERDLHRSYVPMVLLTVSVSLLVLLVSAQEPAVVLVPFPFLALLGERASTTLNTWTLVLLGGVACTVTLLGYGPLASFPTTQQPVGSQLFVLSATVVTLTVALLRDQRRDLGERLNAAHDELTVRDQQASHAEQHRELVIDRAPIGIATVSADPDAGVVHTANHHLLRSLNHTYDAVVGARFRDVLHPDDHGRWSDLCCQARHSEDVGPAQELRIRRRDGAYIFGRAGATMLPAVGETPAQLLVMVEDITAQRQAERALGFSVTRDPVTKLANHMIFADRLHDALAASARSQLAVGVLSIDIDGFRAVNEAVGHACADQVLAAMGHRLTALVRPGDTVARISGDIFAIICPETSLKGLEAVAHGVAEAMAKPVDLRGGPIRITASVGAATGGGATGGGVETARDTWRRAQSAMYRAKTAGRNRVILAQADVISLRPG